MVIDLYEFMLLENVGSIVELDYGVNGVFMVEVNYLVLMQLVSYGLFNFSLDVVVVDVMWLSMKVEYECFNFVCDDFIVVVKNNGSMLIIFMGINYGVVNGNVDVYMWVGDFIMMGEMWEIVLLVSDYLFWEINEEEFEFIVGVFGFNEGIDEYVVNNQMCLCFELVWVVDFEGLVIQLRINNCFVENCYFIWDVSGEVVMECINMSVVIIYCDDIMLFFGCYSLMLEDDGGDGLDFWYWVVVGQNVGIGNVSLC